jgi:hypothetical protein
MSKKDEKCRKKDEIIGIQLSGESHSTKMPVNDLIVISAFFFEIF